VRCGGDNGGVAELNLAYCLDSRSSGGVALTLVSLPIWSSTVLVTS